VAARSKKSREASLVRADGVVWPRDFFLAGNLKFEIPKSQTGRANLNGRQSNWNFRISDLRCRIRPISNFPALVSQVCRYPQLEEIS
jgi:hypothetical protein